jgi:glutamine cyclotransferase
MSNLSLKAAPADYREAMRVLDGKDSKVIGHNTRLEYSNGDVYATYHGNAIVRYDADGSVWASWAGWTSSTTATRLNKLAPARFNIKNFTPQINGEDVDSAKWYKVG